VFLQNYIHEDKGVEQELVVLQANYFTTSAQGMSDTVRFNLSLTFTLGFFLFIVLLYVQLTRLLESSWQKEITLLLYVHDSHNSAQEQRIYDC